MSLNGRTYHPDFWIFIIYQNAFKRIPRKLKKLFKKTDAELSVNKQMCKYLAQKDRLKKER